MVKYMTILVDQRDMLVDQKETLVHHRGIWVDMAQGHIQTLWLTTWALNSISTLGDISQP